MQNGGQMMSRNNADASGDPENAGINPSPGILLSVGIPLYRSKPFLENIRQNIRILLLLNSIEIIISDQHGLDDALDRLEAEWGADPRFVFLRSKKSVPWTENMNILLSVANGKYFRWMPHDDVFPEGSLELLVERLENDPRVILAYGPTRGIDLAGNRITQRDRINTSPVKPNEPWQFQYSLDLYSRGYCDGAFKGLFRRKKVIESGLFIRHTYEMIGAERAWLFGMSLLGGLGEVSDSLYLKRYHASSTHARWKFNRLHRWSITFTMTRYLFDYGPSWRKIIFGITYLWQQVLREEMTRFRKPKKAK